MSQQLTPAERAAALERHLHDHGLIDSEGIDAVLAAAESAEGDRPSTALGAKVVARAWTDNGFRERLLSESVAALSEYAPQSVPIAVLEDGPQVHHVIVCTLCSCYPSGLLGNPPAWYKSFELPQQGRAGTAGGAGRVRDPHPRRGGAPGPRLHG
jgi:nitrile hydratase